MLRRLGIRSKADSAHAEGFRSGCDLRSNHAHSGNANCLAVQKRAVSLTQARLSWLRIAEGKRLASASISSSAILILMRRGRHALT